MVSEGVRPRRNQRVDRGFLADFSCKWQKGNGALGSRLFGVDRPSLRRKLPRSDGRASERQGSVSGQADSLGTDSLYRAAEIVANFQSVLKTLKQSVVSRVFTLASRGGRQDAL